MENQNVHTSKDGTSTSARSQSDSTTGSNLTIKGIFTIILGGTFLLLLVVAMLIGLLRAVQSGDLDISTIIQQLINTQ